MVTTGTVQFTSNGDEIQAYGDSGVYASGGGVTGTAQSSGTWEDSYDFHGQGNMNASANWTYSGSGTSAQSQSDHFSFAGGCGGLTGGDGGTFVPICTSVTTDSSHPSNGATIQNSSTITTGLFQQESGSRSDTLTTLTTWVLDPNGSWRVTRSETLGDGDASGSSSSSDVNSTDGSVHVYPLTGDSFTAVTYHITSPSSASQQYHDTYHFDKITAYDAAGHATTSGSGWGTSSASGSASQDSTVDVAQSGSSSHHGDSSTQVSYSYSGGWTQDYANPNAPATTFGTNTISGQSSYLSADDGGPTFSGTTPISSTTSSPGFGGFYTGAAPASGSFGNPGYGSYAATAAPYAWEGGGPNPNDPIFGPANLPLAPVDMVQHDRLPNACPMCMPSRFKPTAKLSGGPLNWLHTGRWYATDDEYAAGVRAAGDWWYANSPVRGFYAYAGGPGQDNSAGKWWMAGPEAQWTIDDGYTLGLGVYRGYQPSSLGGTWFGGGVAGWYNQDNGGDWGISPGGGYGIPGADKSRCGEIFYGGGQIYFGVGLKYGGAGVIVDPSRFAGGWWDYWSDWSH